ncbi:MAG: 4-hydroxy-tetrahydrodipicolinate synthase [Proteobacteria bacterium]|nr:4-hydroxy-tetrahydrodipicolinate synthase [Pseudomonadota bacterium]
MPQRFRGAITALATPFHDSGAVDYDALGLLIDRQLAAGVAGIALLVSTGEWPTVRTEEARRIIRYAVGRAAGRMQVIAGLGSNDTDRTVEAATVAADLGLDGFLVTCPYYNKPTQAGLYAHHMHLADAVKIPLILYNIAGRSGVNIATDTVLRLAQHDNIAGVKEASGDLDQIMDVIAGAPADFSVLAGDDSMTFAMMAHGGAGVITTVGNLVPEDMVALAAALDAGDLPTARRIHNRLLPLMRGCMIETNPIPVKTALAWKGLIRESFRLPITPMQPETRPHWRALLEDYGFLERVDAAA